MKEPDLKRAAESRRKLNFCCAVVSIALSCCPISLAQTAASPSSPQVPHPPANINTPHQLVITGCLRRDSSGTYSITGDTGKTWDLVEGSAGVDLSKHVFHAVRITGKEAPTEAPPQTVGNSQGQSPPPSVFRVLTLEVLSPSCTR